MSFTSLSLILVRDPSPPSLLKDIVQTYVNNFTVAMATLEKAMKEKFVQSATPTVGSLSD